MKPSGIILQLDLKRPIYNKTASYGHFGRNEPEFTWEKTDKAEILRQSAGHSSRFYHGLEFYLSNLCVVYHDFL